MLTFCHALTMTHQAAIYNCHGTLKDTNTHTHFLFSSVYGIVLKPSKLFFSLLLPSQNEQEENELT